MSNERVTSHESKAQTFPKRILVADIALPNRSEYELTVVSDDHGWGNLPVAPYERADGKEARETE